MPRPVSKYPTGLELPILKVLWQPSPLLVIVALIFGVTVSASRLNLHVFAGTQAEIGDVADEPAAKTKRKLSEVTAINAKLDQLRAEGQAALERGDYSSMSKTYSVLSQSLDASYLDAVWLGHSLHIVGKWKEADAAYQQAIAILDRRLLTLEKLTGPEYEDDADNQKQSRPARDWRVERDRELESLQPEWAKVLLYAGQLELTQLDDPKAAVRTLSRGLRFAPEAESLETLMEAAQEALDNPPERPDRLWFKLMMPIATQRSLALAQEKLGEFSAAAGCWTRLHLSQLAYQVGMAYVDADHLVDIVSRVPAEKRRPFHEFVLKHPGTRREPKPQPFDYQEQLTTDTRNPFRVESKLDGFKMTRLGPSRATVAKLPNGRLVMAYTGGDEFQARIYLSTSADGKTWDAPAEFAHNNFFPTRNPSLIVDDDGVLWMLCSSKRFDLQQYSSGEYRLWLCSSKNGRDWSELQPVKMSFHFSGQYQQTAHITRDRGGKFWIFSPKEFGSANSLRELRELRPIPLLEADQQRFIENMHATFDEENRCHLLFSADGIFHTSSSNMTDWAPAEKIDGEPNHNIDHPQSFTAGNRILAIYDDNRGWLRSGTIAGNRVTWDDRIPIGLSLNGALFLRDGDRLLLPSGPLGVGAAPVLLTAPVAELMKLAARPARDWPQWGGTIHRNNVAVGQTAPRTWNIETRENIKWSVPLGAETYSSPVIANGKVFIGTNNGQGYVKEHPATEDVSCLLAFDELSGKFLWQASNLKLPAGRAEDWPNVGVCSTPYCEEDRVWYVTNRAEVMCLDAEGFHDGENDGPVTDERLKGKDHADIVWRFDMMAKLGMKPRHATNCSVTCLGDRLFVVVSHGREEANPEAARPEVPSFVCLDKRTGQLMWVDASATRNVLECHWSSPCVFEAAGQWQVVMGGGDGWVYSFDPAGDGQGRAKLLWKFDTNPKTSNFLRGSKGTRNYCVATPVFYDGHVYIGNGQDPENGEGMGHLYCVDPTKRGDVSVELAVDAQGQPLAPRRLRAVDAAQGEKTIPNPNSAAVWHYSAMDRDGNGKPDFEGTFHRTLGSVAIANDLLFVADFSGLVHCLDARKSVQGQPVVHWTHDLLAACWSTPLIADGKVFIADEDGDVTIFQLSARKMVLAEYNLGTTIYSTPAVANNTLFLAARNRLHAIADQRVRGEDNGGGDGPQAPMEKPAVLLLDHWIVQAVGFDDAGKELVTVSNQSFITIRRWSREFEPLSPKLDQLVVSGGARDYNHWYLWQTVVPERFEAVLSLTIPQREGPPKLVERKLASGRHKIQVQAEPRDDAPSTNLKLWIGKDDKQTYELTQQLAARPATHPAIVQVLNPGESGRLLNRPLKSSAQPFVVGIRLLPQGAGGATHSQAEPRNDKQDVKPANAVAAKAIYHADPEHLWNRMHEAFFVRRGPDAREYGRDRLEPLLWSDSKHLLEPQSHRQASGQFAKSFDPLERERSFLPPDLFDPNGPWACIGRLDGRTAPQHLRDENPFTNSVFSVFVRLPNGRAAVADRLKELPAFPQGTQLALVRRAKVAANGEIVGQPIDAGKPAVGAAPVDGAQAPRGPAAELARQIQSRVREMSDGRIELAMKFEWPRPTPDNPDHKITTTGTVRWLKSGKLMRLEYDRELPDPFPQSTRLWQEHWTTGFDGDMFYSWDRHSKTVAFGEMRWDSVLYSPQYLFWGQLPQAFEQTQPGPVPQVKRTQRDGRDVWDVSSKDPIFDFGEVFLGLAPERGFLPMHIERTRNALPVGRCELKDFFELKPGVWAAKTLLVTEIPKNIKGKRGGYHAERTEVTITKLELGSDAQLKEEDFALRLPRDVKARQWADNGPLMLPHNFRTALLRFVSGEKQEPLAGLQVQITHGYGDQRKDFGTFTTDDSGTIKVSLPIAFYSLHLKSDKELPYLPVDSLWNKESRGPRPDLSLNVTKNGVEKWLNGKKRDEGYEPPADPDNLPRITYTLLPACELTLRAVDAETGKGLPGVKFYQENAVGEDWAHDVHGQNIGSKSSWDREPVAAAANHTDQDGNFRRLVSANAGYKYGYWNPPTGYEAVGPGEVEIDIRYGQLRAEHVFKFRRIRGDVRVEPAKREPDAATKQGTFRVVVTLVGERPKLPPLEIGDRGVADLKIRQLPDESLSIGEKGGIANVVVFLKQAPPSWKPTPPPAEPVLIEAVDARFSPRVAVLRIGQELKLKNSMPVGVNVRSNPIRGQAFNMLLQPKTETLIDRKQMQTEQWPSRVNCDLFPWMQSSIISLDHPFVAVTDRDGSCEIAGLPPGDYEFRVWHERSGIIEKKLPVRVAAGQATELTLKYSYDVENSRFVKANDQPANERGARADRPPTSEEIFAGKVSLHAKAMPLKHALAELARQARVELQLDIEALKKVDLDVDEPVTANVQDEPLKEAIGSLIDWRDHLGAFPEIRAGQLVLTTVEARHQRIVRELPDWLKPLHGNGLLATLDEERQVESITSSRIMTDELLEQLATLRKLREIHIEVTTKLTPAGLKHLGQMRQLERLSLYEVNQDGNGLGDQTIQAIVGLKSLRELRLSGCGVTDAGGRLLEELPQLTRLELCEGRLTDATLTSIGKLKLLKLLSLSSYGGTLHYGRMHFNTDGLRSLTGLQELEELHLVGQSVTADLLAFPKLTSLSLGGPTVDDACAERIAACRRLKSLSLVYSGVTDAGIQQIATLPALQQLNLDSNVITDAAMAHVKAVKTLELLTLRTTKLTDESLRHIAEMKSLTWLALHGSGQPGAVAGENFSINALRQLKALPKLRTLYLTNLHSPTGFLALKDLTQLRVLSLMMANPAPGEFEALEAALPNTTILNMNGGGDIRFPKTKRERKPAPD